MTQDELESRIRKLQRQPLGSGKLLLPTKTQAQRFFVRRQDVRSNRKDSPMYRTRAILVVLFLILATPLCANPSYAQTVTFSYSFSCDTNKDPYCLQSNLHVANGLGGTAGDSVTIATVNSDVPGYTQPIPISKGLLNFISSPATRVMCDPPPSGCYAIYDNPGGSAAITRLSLWSARWK